MLDTHMYDLHDEAVVLAERNARNFNFEGLCPYCGTPFTSEDGGWIAVFPDDGDQIDPADLFVVEWGGWFSKCGHCNDDGDRWPGGQIRLAPDYVGECDGCPDARACEREGTPTCRIS